MRKLRRFFISTGVLGILLFLQLRAPAPELAVYNAPHEERGTAPEKAGSSLGREWFRIERVVDGDTVVLQMGNAVEKVRLIGVDSPELGGSDEATYGADAARFLQKILEGRRVRIDLDRAPRDMYGRFLAYVFAEDGTFVNAEMVREGFARAMTVPPNTKYADLFVSLEQEAREKKTGLWQNLEFRRENSPN